MAFKLQEVLFRRMETVWPEKCTLVPIWGPNVTRFFREILCGSIVRRNFMKILNFSENKGSSIFPDWNIKQKL